MDELYSFGTWVQRRRRSLPLTQAELARRIGVATVTIQKIEADERHPSHQVAELLGLQRQITPGDRDAFLSSARGERSIDHPEPTAALGAHPLFAGASQRQVLSECEGTGQRVA